METTEQVSGPVRRPGSANGCALSPNSLHAEEDSPLSTKPAVPCSSAEAHRPPVRVRLRRRSSQHAIPIPRDAQQREWWDRLKKAFGTASSEFVWASLQQLIGAARLPCDGISEVAVNAALAMVEGAKPRSEIECALVMQMACAHTAAMAVLSRLGGAHGGGRNVAMMSTAASKLMRTYAMQAETLRRLRHGGSQYMRIEHVQISEGAQAVFGVVGARD